VLAAHRAGIRRIILPAQNENDVEEIPEDVRKELEIIPATRVSDVLKAALESEVSTPRTDFILPNLEPTNSDSQSEPLIAKENAK